MWKKVVVEKVLNVGKMEKIFKQYLRNHYNYADLLRNKSKNAKIGRACYKEKMRPNCLRGGRNKVKIVYRYIAAI